MSYTQKTDIEHVLDLPGLYIGSVTSLRSDVLVSRDSVTIESVEEVYNPGLIKIIDELIVNVSDEVSRNPKKKHSVDIDITPDSLTILNSGNIPITDHPKLKIPIPEMIFSRLRTSKNYDNEQRVTGGLYGYGVKLTNIFSKRFEVEISTGKNVYTQTFEGNNQKIGKPVITKDKGSAHVKITTFPDFARFGVDRFDEIHMDIIRKRCLDLYAYGNLISNLSMTLNGKKISFQDYGKLYSEEAIVAKGIEAPRSKLWFFKTLQPFQATVINGVEVKNGGTHVNFMYDMLASVLSSRLRQKITRKVVMQSIGMVWMAEIPNVLYDWQSKQAVNSPVSTFKDFGLPDSIYKQLHNGGIIEHLQSQMRVQEVKELKRKDGKRVRVLNITNYDGAVWAGGAKSSECTLILTEGLSAKAFASIGVSSLELYNTFGIFPLKGKLLNVRGKTDKTIDANEEIANLKRILGLRYREDYTNDENFKRLRYGRIMIMTDADTDGSHIRGLIMNMFDSLWPSLLQRPGFITAFRTPIVKISKPEYREFYTLHEFENYKKTHPGAVGKYYKGLGTSTSTETKEYFKQLERNTVIYEFTEETGDAFDLAFSKDKTNERKRWLMRDLDPVPLGKRVAFDKFIHNDLILFSMNTITRAIPNIMDGLKESQRKIIFAAFKRKLTSEIKVSQLAGYVSEVADYHHGEKSLEDAIVNMARNYPGSNNIHYLVPNGQFGNRKSTASASARYIYTFLNPQIRKIFKEEDESLLKMQMFENQEIEPAFYLPVLPMILVNGASGLATGFSTNIPSYKPADIARNITTFLNGGKMIEMTPWYMGAGNIVLQDSKYYSLIKFEQQGLESFTITELPIQLNAASYIEKLKSLGAEVVDMSSENSIHIKVKGISELPSQSMQVAMNLVCLDEHGVVRIFSNVLELLEYWVRKRRPFFEKRKKHLMKLENDRVSILKNKVRFINEMNAGTLDLYKKRSELTSYLLGSNYDKHGDVKNYDYLLTMPFSSLTLERATALQKELEQTEQRIEKLKNMTGDDLWLQDLNQIL